MKIVWEKKTAISQYMTIFKIARTATKGTFFGYLFNFSHAQFLVFRFIHGHKFWFQIPGCKVTFLRVFTGEVGLLFQGHFFYNFHERETFFQAHYLFIEPGEKVGNL